MCVIPRGKRDVYVTPAVDSSRNFKLRIEDPESGRHAFVGLSFSERSDAFSFNVALVRSPLPPPVRMHCQAVSNDTSGLPPSSVCLGRIYAS